MVAIELLAGAVAVCFAFVGLLLSGIGLLAGDVSFEMSAYLIAGIAAFTAVGAITHFVFAGRKGVREMPAWAFACMWMGVGLVGMSYFFKGLELFRLALPLVVATLHLTLERLFAART